MQVQTELMKTKAGRRFVGFLKTFNGGEVKPMQNFVAQYTTDEALEQNTLDAWIVHLGAIYAQTGGLRALQVMASDEYRVVLLMQAHANESLHVVEMAVSEEYPHKVAEFIHRPAA